MFWTIRCYVTRAGERFLASLTLNPSGPAQVTLRQLLFGLEEIRNEIPGKIGGVGRLCFCVLCPASAEEIEAYRRTAGRPVPGLGIQWTLTAEEGGATNGN